MTQWGLDTIFNPAKRHMDDEKRRLQSTREEVGDNSGGKRIDFESGKVRIPGAGDDADGASGTEDAPNSGTDASAREEAVVKVAAKHPEPTAAQIRAAARRGRKLD